MEAAGGEFVGTRLMILMWPFRMAGRAARRVVRTVIPNESDMHGPGHPSGPHTWNADGSSTAQKAREGTLEHIKPTPGGVKGSLTISMLEVRERMNDLVLLDCREPHEVDLGHIPGAVPIPLGQIGKRFSELDPGHHIVTYCASGRRSMDAAKQLRELGFAQVQSMAGGFARWVRDGGDVARPGDGGAQA